MEESTKDFYAKKVGKRLLKDKEPKFNTIMENNKKNLFENNSKYTKRKSIFYSPLEQKLYESIKQKLNSNYQIFPQICLRTIIEKSVYYETNDLYRITDFCVVNAKTYEPLLAIELNGQQHKNNLAIKINDISKKEILKKAKIPTITIQSNKINIDEILKKIYKKIGVI